MMMTTTSKKKTKKMLEKHIATKDATQQQHFSRWLSACVHEIDVKSERTGDQNWFCFWINDRWRKSERKNPKWKLLA